MQQRSTTSRSTRGPWIAVAVVGVIALAAGWWTLSGRHARPPQSARTAPPASRPFARAEIAIEGMDCLMCAAGLQNKLRTLQGVAKAEVNYQDHRAVIEFDPAVIDRARLVATIEGDGFKVLARDVSPQAVAPPAP